MWLVGLMQVAAVQGEAESADMLDFLYSPLIWLWLNRIYVYTCAALGLTVWICSHFLTTRKKHQEEKLHQNGSPSLLTKALKNDVHASHKEEEVHVAGVKIFYGSQTGTAKGFAHHLAGEVAALDLPVEIINMKEYDPDDNLMEETTSSNICVFLVATYTDGQPPESAEWFCKWLDEASNDFRFGKTFLKGLRYAVFGLGNSVYNSHYNTVGKNIDKWLWMLSGSRVMTRAEGDGNVVKSKHGSIEADFSAWKAKFLSRLQALVKGEKKSCSGKCKKGKCKSKGKSSTEALEQEQSRPGDSEHEDTEEEQFETTSESESDGEGETGAGGLIDVEDLGKAMSSMKKAKRARDVNEEAGKMSKSLQSPEAKETREMITPALQEALTKQGYRLIGSHSGVKLCRWTKSMLRGRGGCYKHSFYGIESHRCMETTPSLACANKCVFCWRHHTNPVGTEWRWKMDQPEMILEGAIENHQNMIKQFKGMMPTKKQCGEGSTASNVSREALNIFFHIQHEAQCLEPVTQLYVSVDASTKDSLKKIDRPLFKDFWQRFIDSLKALAEKQQRTVYRLTLVKAWNVDELKAYADLVTVGRPDFIEVKGVTYCGESSASNLTMANVPWHEEVIHFVQELGSLLPDYELACEHEHSNCLLVAHKKFKIDGEWWTWIDYERFQELIRTHRESGGRQLFTALDYVAKTPEWALFGSRQRGFDPVETRFQRKNKTKDISGC
ncbi:hypothetical protein FKM82_008767 [Ascaphus truei]